MLGLAHEADAVALCGFGVTAQDVQRADESVALAERSPDHGRVPDRRVDRPRILGRHADGAVLVVRADKTTRDDALIAKQRLADDGILVLGTILNGWDLKAKARYGYSTYSYRYQEA